MSIGIGDVVMYKSHPYTENNQNIQIATYVDYTSPIMIVCKKGENKKYDIKTGRALKEYVECLYYNSRDGKFGTKRINVEELLTIDLVVKSNERKRMLKEIEIDFNLEEDLNSLLNRVEHENIYKNVALKSVDLELHKEKITRERENGELVVTNHLEFLPPVMTVIGCRFIDEKNKFCVSSGRPAIELKCKWYNSHLKTFSEDYFRIETLFKIEFLIDERDLLTEYKEQIETNLFNLIELDKGILLEGTKDKVNYSLIQIEAIVFKHYFYEALTFDILKNKKNSVLIGKTIESIENNVLWGKTFPDYNNRKYLNGIGSFGFVEGEYYHISYADRFNRFSKRIVKVRDIFFVINNKEAFLESLKSNGADKNNIHLKEFIDDVKLFFVTYNLQSKFLEIRIEKGDKNKIVLPLTILSNKNIDVLLETNCLLREGKIRHFRLDGIYEAKALNYGVELLEKGKIMKEE